MIEGDFGDVLRSKFVLDLHSAETIGILQVSKRKKIPVFVLGTDLKPMEKAAPLQDGADAILDKPVSAEVLTE